MRLLIWILGFLLIGLCYCGRRRGNKRSCSDILSKKNFVKAQGKNHKIEKVTSCSRIVECYPNMCDDLGGKQGKCCKACQKIEDLTCMDQVTECQVLPVTINRKALELTSCEELVNKYPELCASKYQYGKKGGACCKSCKSATKQMVKCSPKDHKVDCFCYPKEECDGKMVIACPRGGKDCKKLGKNYQCCCKNVFWHPFCKFDVPKKKVQEVEEMPIDENDPFFNLDDFFGDFEKLKNSFK